MITRSRIAADHHLLRNPDTGGGGGLFRLYTSVISLEAFQIRSTASRLIDAERGRKVPKKGLCSFQMFSLQVFNPSNLV